MRQREPLHTPVGMWINAIITEYSIKGPQKRWQLQKPYNPAIPLLGISPEKMKPMASNSALKAWFTASSWYPKVSVYLTVWNVSFHPQQSRSLEVPDCPSSFCFLKGTHECLFLCWNFLHLCFLDSLKSIGEFSNANSSGKICLTSQCKWDEHSISLTVCLRIWHSPKKFFSIIRRHIFSSVFSWLMFVHLPPHLLFFILMNIKRTDFVILTDTILRQPCCLLDWSNSIIRHKSSVYHGG